MMTRPTILAMLLLTGGCGAQSAGDSGGSLRAELAECREGGDRLEQENNALKVQLAEALASPGRPRTTRKIEVDGQVPPPDAGAAPGTLSQAEVVATVQKGRPALQECYDQAIRADRTLHNKPIKLVVAFRVQPSGVARDISVRPAWSEALITCITRSVGAWRFPTFAGAEVGIEMPITLSPNKMREPTRLSPAQIQ